MTDHSPNVRQANYALALLLLAYILSFVDRNVMAVLIGPIRAEFAISDFQYSLLHGFAFSMFYIVLGLPIARLADRHNRVRIIGVGVFLWSLMTCLCGAARSFGGLFLARVGVGVGEAALSPAAFSLLSDLFPKEKLARALAIYSLGITLGGGLAYVLGGAAYAWFAGMAPLRLPLFGAVSAWQMTFIAVGAPGLLLTALLMLLKEPPRQGVAQRSVTAGVSLADVCAQFRRHWLAYLGIIGPLSLLAVLGYGTMAWYPEFLIRSFGMPRDSAGSQFGTLFLVAGSLGTLAAGWCVQPLMQRGFVDAPVRLIGLIALLWIVPASLGPLAPSAALALLAAGPIVFCLNAYYGVGIAALQFITPNPMRAQASALLLFCTNFFGLALGPTAVAGLTDFLFRDEQALNQSLALLPLLVCPAAAVLAFASLRAFRGAERTVE
ncbi:spinster family MFS transporter [Parahaliea aestuarii]|uniref:MFS transporter n=1 Tax=Parahaliea aestuarii TaxID=1852021 RepID=A0A5C8ZPD8_9GAMM|nr:MFS transporter [Parahaliea aestuarii]TXS89590.1 MFS transporter [Parahaliea aestuarii]